MVEILSPLGHAKYLGRILCMDDLHQSELNSRIGGAWAAFTQYSGAFKSRAYSFPLKARLFDAVVAPVVLYGSPSWTLTNKMEEQLRTTRRKLLCARRRPEEDWVAFIKRTTADAETRMVDLNYSCWATTFRRRKWKFAGKVAQAMDNRWSKRILGWMPFFRCFPWRSVGRPLARWGDCFEKVVGGDWASIAASDVWPLLEHGFANRVA